MHLADLHPRKRAENVKLALDIALRELKEPAPTADIVSRLADLLHTSERQLIAAIVDREFLRSHPQARQTGEVFKRYGREMRRWEWIPAGRMSTAARKAAQLEAEADDMWTVRPGEPALSDEDPT